MPPLVFAGEARSLQAELARLGPAETLTEAKLPGVRSIVGKGGFDAASGTRALKGRFAVATLDGFGDLTIAELAAIVAGVVYLIFTTVSNGVLLWLERRYSLGVKRAEL